MQQLLGNIIRNQMDQEEEQSPVDENQQQLQEGQSQAKDSARSQSEKPITSQRTPVLYENKKEATDAGRNTAMVSRSQQMLPGDSNSENLEQQQNNITERQMWNNINQEAPSPQGDIGDENEDLYRNMPMLPISTIKKNILLMDFDGPKGKRILNIEDPNGAPPQAGPAAPANIKVSDLFFDQKTLMKQEIPGAQRGRTRMNGQMLRNQQWRGGNNSDLVDVPGLPVQQLTSQGYNKNDHWVAHINAQANSKLSNGNEQNDGENTKTVIFYNQNGSVMTSKNQTAPGSTVISPHFENQNSQWADQPLMDKHGTICIQPLHVQQCDSPKDIQDGSDMFDMNALQSLINTDLLNIETAGAADLQLTSGTGVPANAQALGSPQISRRDQLQLAMTLQDEARKQFKNVKEFKKLQELQEKLDQEQLDVKSDIYENIRRSFDITEANKQLSPHGEQAQNASGCRTLMNDSALSHQTHSYRQIMTMLNSMEDFGRNLEIQQSMALQQHLQLAHGVQITSQRQLQNVLNRSQDSREFARYMDDQDMIMSGHKITQMYDINMQSYNKIMLREIDGEAFDPAQADELIQLASAKNRQRLSKSVQGMYQNIMSGPSRNLHQSVSNCYKHCEACHKILLDQQVQFIKQKYNFNKNLKKLQEMTEQLKLRLNQNSIQNQQELLRKDIKDVVKELNHQAASENEILFQRGLNQILNSQRLAGKPKSSKYRVFGGKVYEAVQVKVHQFNANRRIHDESPLFKAPDTLSPDNAALLLNNYQLQPKPNQADVKIVKRNKEQEDDGQKQQLQIPCQMKQNEVSDKPKPKGDRSLVQQPSLEFLSRDHGSQVPFNILSNQNMICSPNSIGSQIQYIKELTQQNTLALNRFVDGRRPSTGRQPLERSLVQKPRTRNALTNLNTDHPNGTLRSSLQNLHDSAVTSKSPKTKSKDAPKHPYQRIKNDIKYEKEEGQNHEDSSVMTNQIGYGLGRSSNQADALLQQQTDMTCTPAVNFDQYSLLNRSQTSQSTMLATIQVQNLLRIKSKHNQAGFSTTCRMATMGVSGKQTGFVMNQTEINKAKEQPKLAKKASTSKPLTNQRFSNDSTSTQGTKAQSKTRWSNLNAMRIAGPKYLNDQPQNIILNFDQEKPVLINQSRALKIQEIHSSNVYSDQASPHTAASPNTIKTIHANESRNVSGYIPPADTGAVVNINLEQENLISNTPKIPADPRGNAKSQWSGCRKNSQTSLRRQISLSKLGKRGTGERRKDNTGDNDNSVEENDIDVNMDEDLEEDNFIHKPLNLAGTIRESKASPTVKDAAQHNLAQKTQSKESKDKIIRRSKNASHSVPPSHASHNVQGNSAETGQPSATIITKRKQKTSANSGHSSMKRNQTSVEKVANDSKLNQDLNQDDYRQRNSIASQELKNKEMDEQKYSSFDHQKILNYDNEQDKINIIFLEKHRDNSLDLKNQQLYIENRSQVKTIGTCSEPLSLFENKYIKTPQQMFDEDQFKWHMAKPPSRIKREILNSRGISGSLQQPNKTTSGAIGTRTHAAMPNMSHEYQRKSSERLSHLQQHHENRDIPAIIHTSKPSSFIQVSIKNLSPANAGKKESVSEAQQLSQPMADPFKTVEVPSLRPSQRGQKPASSAKILLQRYRKQDGQNKSHILSNMKNATMPLYQNLSNKPGKASVFAERYHKGKRNMQYGLNTHTAEAADCKFGSLAFNNHKSFLKESRGFKFGKSSNAMSMAKNAQLLGQRVLITDKVGEYNTLQIQENTTPTHNIRAPQAVSGIHINRENILQIEEPEDTGAMSPNTYNNIAYRTLNTQPLTLNQIEGFNETRVDSDQVHSQNEPSSGPDFGNTADARLLGKIQVLKTLNMPSGPQSKDCLQNQRALQELSDENTENANLSESELIQVEARYIEDLLMSQMNDNFYQNPLKLHNILPSKQNAKLIRAADADYMNQQVYDKFTKTWAEREGVRTDVEVIMKDYKQKIDHQYAKVQGYLSNQIPLYLAQKHHKIPITRKEGADAQDRRRVCHFEAADAGRTSRQDNDSSLLKLALQHTSILPHQIMVPGPSGPRQDSKGNGEASKQGMHSAFETRMRQRSQGSVQGHHSTQMRPAYPPKSPSMATKKLNFNVQIKFLNQEKNVDIVTPEYNMEAIKSANSNAKQFSLITNMQTRKMKSPAFLHDTGHQQRPQSHKDLSQVSPSYMIKTMKLGLPYHSKHAAKASKKTTIAPNQPNTRPYHHGISTGKEKLIQLESKFGTIKVSHEEGQSPLQILALQQSPVQHGSGSKMSQRHDIEQYRMKPNKVIVYSPKELTTKQNNAMNRNSQNAFFSSLKSIETQEMLQHRENMNMPSNKGTGREVEQGGIEYQEAIHATPGSMTFDYTNQDQLYVITTKSESQISPVQGALNIENQENLQYAKAQNTIISRQFTVPSAGSPFQSKKQSDVNIDIKSNTADQQQAEILVQIKDITGMMDRARKGNQDIINVKPSARSQYEPYAKHKGADVSQRSSVGPRAADISRRSSVVGAMNQKSGPPSYVAGKRGSQPNRQESDTALNVKGHGVQIQ